MDELEQLIAEQAKDMRYDGMVWPEPIVAFSLDAKLTSDPGSGDFSEFLTNDGWVGKEGRSRDMWRCVLHGRTYGYLEDGNPRCRACRRASAAAYRRRKGMKPRKIGPQCTHGAQWVREYKSNGKLYCRMCKSIDAKAYRDRLKAKSLEYVSPSVPEAFVNREDVVRVG